MERSVIDIICDEARRESEELKEKRKLASKNFVKKGWVEITPNSLISPASSHAIVALNEQPVSIKNFVSFDPNVRATLGYYWICYVPTGDRRCSGNKHFVIYQDMVSMGIKVSGWGHWYHLCERIPELDWIRRNTSISRELFLIAKRHPGIKFIFAVDWAKYAEKIINRANELGIDIDNKPFVAYTCSKEDYLTKYKDKVCLKKSADDYRKEIEEAELETVQGEEE